jgi:ribonuclease E
VNVKQYRESLPLFARFQVETYLAGMFNPTVQLKSGGYIVIGVTEALVAIDVNSGRATKEGSIEETALKTNLEAAEEVARQLRLRDLAGLIVIDFIDMDERKNNAAVEKRMKDRLKTDRARIQVGRISGFGLMEMSRQRLRPGMIEATTQPCAACHGTGLIRSDDNLALSILRQIEEEGTRRRSREVLVKAPVGIANFLMNQKREHIAQIEARYGLSVRVEGDPHLVSPDFALEKFKTATRVVPAASAHVVSVDTSIMDQIDEDEAQSEAAAQSQSQSQSQDDVQTQDGNGEGDGKPKRKRRRRSRRRGGSKNNGEGYTNGASADGDSDVTEDGDATPAQAETVTAKDASVDADAPAPEEGDKAEDAPAPKKKTTRTRSTTSKAKGKSAAAKKAEAEAEAGPAAAEQADAPEAKAEDAEAAPAKPKRTRKPAAPRARKPKADAEPDASVNDAAKAQPVDAAPAPEPEAAQAPTPAPKPAPAAKPAPEPVPEPVGSVASSEPAKPKRKGWWSLGK